MALTLAANINAATETITVSGTVPGIAIKGFRFAIDNEAMEFRRFAGADEPYPLPTVNTTWIVYRGVNGTSAASHTAGATLYAVRDALTKGADVATVPGPFPEGGTELSADIVDALEGAASPDAGNVFATMDDLPSGGILTATKHLVTADILALTTPVVIVAGQPGKILMPISAQLQQRSGDTPFSGTGILVSIGHPSLSGAEVAFSVEAGNSNFLGFDGLQWFAPVTDIITVPLSWDQTIAVGEPLVISADDDFTDGNGAADVYVQYLVIPVS